MTLFRALLLGFCGWFTTSNFFVNKWFSAVTEKPIIAAFFCGLIMGDMKAAMEIGVVLQAMYLGFMAVGGVSSMPEIKTCQWFAIPLCIMEGKGAEYAIVIALAFSALDTLVNQLIVQLDIINIRLSDKLVVEGKLRKAYYANLSGQVWNFLKCMIVITTANLVGATLITAVADNCPEFVTGIMSVFITLCPIIGFSLLLNSLLTSKAQFVFFLLGFTLFLGLGLSYMQVTVIALVLAYIVWIATDKKGKEEAAS